MRRKVWKLLRMDVLFFFFSNRRRHTIYWRDWSSDVCSSDLQNAIAYRLRVGAGDPGEPVTRIAPRALLAPPGWPDFMTRERFVRPGPVLLTGRAWSGRAPVTAVEVSTDGGAIWSAAELAPADPAHPFAWRSWSFTWTAEPGSSELVARATDAEGGQPTEQVWNRQGMANNLVQRVPVTVLE